MLKQLRLCVGMGICCGLKCRVCCYLGFLGLCLTCCRAALESCLHISSQLNCCSTTICQGQRGLSTTVRSGYGGRILCACNKCSRPGLSADPLYKKGRNYPSDFDLSVTLTKGAAAYLSLQIGVSSVQASTMTFSPQIKVRAELLGVW